MNFYNHYLGDYARDTKGLSLVEHGAYRVLLDHVYATEQRLPDDLAELYRIAGAMTATERKAVDKVASLFFPVNGDGRRANKRAEEEIAKAKVKSAKAKGSAETRWKANGSASGERTDMPSHMRTHSGGNANQNQNQEESKTSEAIASDVPVPGTTPPLPACPHLQIVGLYHEILTMCPRVADWTAARQQMLRSRWREQAMPSGKRKGYTDVEGGLAHWRRFFTYVAGSAFLTGNAEGRNGAPPFVADLEWLVRPKNFVKVVEGHYHR